MSPQASWSTFTWLLAALLVFLSAATVVGAWLLWRARRRGVEGAALLPWLNLHQRNLSWWAIIAVCATAFHFERWGTLVLCAGLSFLALRELIAALPWRDDDHPTLALVCWVLLPLQYLAVALAPTAVWALLLPLWGLLVLPVWRLRVPVSPGWLDGLMRLQWLPLWAIYTLSHIPALWALPLHHRPDAAVMLAIFLVLVVQMSDVCQFIFGKLLGRRPLAPQLSPGKTLEGTVLGMGAATLLGAALAGITPFGPWQAAGVAGLLCLTGLLGGLVMSAIKRERGLKDWGHSVPGHGGVLDRLDSVLLSAPVYFHVVKWGWVA